MLLVLGNWRVVVCFCYGNDRNVYYVDYCVMLGVLMVCGLFVVFGCY